MIFDQTMVPEIGTYQLHSVGAACVLTNVGKRQLLKMRKRGRNSANLKEAVIKLT